jgi:hypothetical protein
VEDQNPYEYCQQLFWTTQLFLQSLQSLIHIYYASLLDQYSFDCTLTCNTSSTMTSRIISIERIGQEDFYDIHVFGTNNYIIEDGSIHHNSGKSHSLVMKMIKLSYLNKDFHGGLLCPSYAEFKKDIFPLIESIMENSKIVRADREYDIGWYYNDKDHFIRFPWMKKNRRLFCFSGDASSLKGPNLAFMCVNELSFIKKDLMLQALARVRVKAPHSQRLLVGTLDDVYNYFDDLIVILEKTRDFSWYKSITTENKHLSDDYIEALKAQYDSQALKVFMYGEHVRLGDSYFYYQYSNGNLVENKKCDSLQTYVGLDFNFSRMTCHFGHKIQNEYRVFDEMVLKGDSNTYTICRAIKEKYEDWANFIIICDASGAARKSSALEQALSDVAILRNAGFTVRFKNQNPRIRKRQLLMNSMLEKKTLVLDPSCKETAKDLQKVKQKEDYTKDPGKDNSLGHLSDGLDYVVDYLFNPDNNLSRSKISIA